LGKSSIVADEREIYRKKNFLIISPTSPFFFPLHKKLWSEKRKIIISTIRETAFEELFFLVEKSWSVERSGSGVQPEVSFDVFSGRAPLPLHSTLHRLSRLSFSTI